MDHASIGWIRNIATQLSMTRKKVYRIFILQFLNSVSGKPGKWYGGVKRFKTSGIDKVL